jgi:hypothetical protein
MHLLYEVVSCVTPLAAAAVFALPFLFISDLPQMIAPFKH